MADRADPAGPAVTAATVNIVGDLPDVPGWTRRRQIRSGSSSRLYTVAQRVNPGKPDHGLWGCSCMGWKRTRNCKHLIAMGLPSCGRAAIGTGPARKAARPNSASFQDSAYAHYDTSAGYGSVDEWLRVAESLAEGRGAFRGQRPRTGRVTPDMRLLDLDKMPADAAGLVRAMRKRARVLHPDVVHPTDGAHRARFPNCADCDQASRAFTAMTAAYGRLMRRHYPKEAA